MEKLSSSLPLEPACRTNEEYTAGVMHRRQPRQPHQVVNLVATRGPRELFVLFHVHVRGVGQPFVSVVEEGRCSAVPRGGRRILHNGGKPDILVSPRMRGGGVPEARAGPVSR